MEIVEFNKDELCIKEFKIDLIVWKWMRLNQQSHQESCLK